MTRPAELYQWANTVASRLPHLSKPTAFVLALWSFGMALAHSCGLAAVSLALAPLLDVSDNTVRQRLREFYKPKDKKAGTQRRQLDPRSCFVALLLWAVADWTCRRLVLALDVTNLGERFHVLAISVVVRGCGIPVAWTILPGNQKDAWHPHWCALLERLRPALTPDWQVLVLSDRGLESPRLFRVLTGLGWHPLMRVKGAGRFRPAGWHRFYPLAQFAPAVGTRFRAAGEAYKDTEARLSCTLLASWAEGHDSAWLLLTDLAPTQGNPCWYAYRAWVEQNFKVIKRAGWQWQRTRMSDPRRAERLWVAVAVATLWLVGVGSVAEDEVLKETLPRLRQAPGRSAGKPHRQHRVFRRGLAVLLAWLTSGRGLPVGRVSAETWPEPDAEVPTMTEQELTSNKTYP